MSLRRIVTYLLDVLFTSLVATLIFLTTSKLFVSTQYIVWTNPHEVLHLMDTRFISIGVMALVFSFLWYSVKWFVKTEKQTKGQSNEIK
ncbi:hypothetical protein QUF88_08040 [Bacillus sp. DX1.1]|uniref:hypothetical protein n=1 Tax=unclassified Bacillus (in: firmicutes) TaxID=185979 RepID=UPI0025706314|nr:MULTISPECIES: hypothetical protein [unclassified Bacillus (in: firmicutes)]MDM5153779.1 hypothetical protein [Bacillus sp. DX1.1]WJE82716.1 hypothetical protein QRE67_05545 [Bacillus sp. DX3.1]